MRFQLTTILALALTSTAIANFVPAARSNDGIAARDMKNGQRRDEIPVEGEVASVDEIENSWDDEDFEGNTWDFDTDVEADEEEEETGEEVARREDVGVPIEGAETPEVAEGEGESLDAEEDEDEGEDEDEEEDEEDEEEEEETEE